MKPKILLVEDDAKLTALLCQYFEQYGFEIESQNSGHQLLERLNRFAPDLLILDMMLPGPDGLSICREVRNQYPGQILFLTASGDDMDQVAALEMGADDYVCKPIQPRVLLARIRTLLRRPSATVPTALATPSPQYLIQMGQLHLDQRRSAATLNDSRVELTQAEFDVLWLLAQNKDTPLSRDVLVKETRGIEYDGLDRTIDNRIAALRKKLGDNPQSPNRIITVRGKGYLLASDQW